MRNYFMRTSLLLAWIVNFSVCILQLAMVMASSTQLLNQQHSDVEINTNDTAKKDLRIIGGMEATEDRYMYTVSFLDGNNFAFCGGSLILKDVVLTAAHCLDGGKDFQVAVGRYDLTDKDGERISVKQTIIHPFYKTRGDHNYDFALVILSSPVQDDNIQLIKLNNDNAHPNQGSIAHVMGWGDTDPGSAVVTVTALQIVSVEVISNEECETITINGQNYQGMIDESMLCTFAEGQDACQGDSGGPLIIRGNTAADDVQIGIVSWGVGCAYLPGVFSRVSMVYGWIEDNACKRSVDKSGSSLCTMNEATTVPSWNPTSQLLKESTESSEPTLKPTSKLSNAPSLRPSKASSIQPSQNPSLSKATSTDSTVLSTSPPSSAPSQAPSALPTSPPTATPSKAPTDSPTLSSSAAPSKAQTLIPVTLPPSEAPTKAPTTSPTSFPLAAPSTAPTLAPVTSPPSLTPSTAPTDLPTSPPSAAPSKAPSVLPTLSLSAAPSKAPTLAPATSPPSAAPTKAPTTSLTSFSSAAPSTAPTLAPVTPPPSSATSAAPADLLTLTPPVATSNAQTHAHATVTSPLLETSSKTPTLAPVTSPPSKAPSTAPVSLSTSPPSERKTPTTVPSAGPSTRLTQPTPQPSNESSVNTLTTEPSQHPSSSRSSRQPTQPSSRLPTRQPTSPPTIALTPKPSRSPSNSLVSPSDHHHHMLQPIASHSISAEPTTYPSRSSLIPVITSAPTSTITNAVHMRNDPNEDLSYPLIIPNSAIDSEEFVYNSSSRMKNNTLFVTLMSFAVSNLPSLLRL